MRRFILIALLAACTAALAAPAAQAGSTSMGNGCTLYSYSPNIDPTFNNFGIWEAHGKITCSIGTSIQIKVCMRQLISTGWNTLDGSCKEHTYSNTGGYTVIGQWSWDVPLTVDRWYKSWAWAYTVNKNGTKKATNQNNPGVCIRNSSALCMGSAGSAP